MSPEHGGSTSGIIVLIHLATRFLIIHLKHIGRLNEIMMMGVAERFNRVYMGDSVIERVHIDPLSQQCAFFLSAASVLKDVPKPSIFDPEVRYEPACLRFEGVRSVSCPEGEYYLNPTIVNFQATPISHNELVEFRFRMTGGFDNESFMRSFVIVARDFSLGGVN